MYCIATVRYAVTLSRQLSRSPSSKVPYVITALQRKTSKKLKIFLLLVICVGSEGSDQEQPEEEVTTEPNQTLHATFTKPNSGCENYENKLRKLKIF